jgi:hypothetical protein
MRIRKGSPKEVMMLGYIMAMVHSAVVLIFILSTLLLFAFLIVVKKKKTASLEKIKKIYSIIPLGALAFLGAELLFAGIRETLHGEIEIKQFMIIGLGLTLIAGAGVPFYIFFVAGKLAEIKLETRKKKYPDAPWMWGDKWLEKAIVYSGTGRLILFWFVISVVISGFVFVTYMNREIILAKMQGTSRFEVIAFFSIIFFILSISLLLVVSHSRGILKFGKSSLEMSTYPGVIGGEFAGTIRTQMRGIPKDGFTLELDCELTEIVTPDGRPVRDPYPVSVWKAKKKIPMGELNMDYRGVSVPVSFSIPADTQESDEWSSDKRIHWMLSAFSSFEGRQYLSQFIVPVFKTRSKS